MLKLRMLTLAAIGIILQDSSIASPSEKKRSLADPLARSSLLEQKTLLQKQWEDVVREKRQDDDTPEFGTVNPESGIGGSTIGIGGQQSGSGFSFSNIKNWFGNLFQKATIYLKNVMQTFGEVMQGMGGGQTTGSLPSDFNQS